jgi:hypothetical protein
MSTLYIGNTTKKTQIFLYRVPEDPRPTPLRMEIRPGSQERLPSRDLSMPAIEAIVAAHAPYGLIPVSEVPRHKPFVGMCYSIDREIPLERIQLGLVHNDELLETQGREIRAAAAIATTNAISQQTGGVLNELELSVEEEKPEKHDANSDALGKQTILVSSDANPDAPTMLKGRAATRRGRGGK